MAPPFALSLAARRLYGQFQQLDDPEGGYPWAVLCAAVAAPVDPLYDLLASSANPWELAFDLDNAPDWILPWLAQFRGVDLAGISDPDDQRALIRTAPARRRGTPEARKAAVRPFLTGAKRVILTERVGGNPYITNLATYASETPDPDAVERAAKAAGPAGRQVNVSVITGGTFDALLATHASFQDVLDHFATFQAIVDDPTA